MLGKRFASAALLALAAALPAGSSLACTRVLWNDGGPAILVGRTMDWPEIDRADPDRPAARPPP